MNKEYLEHEGRGYKHSPWRDTEGRSCPQVTCSRSGGRLRRAEEALDPSHQIGTRLDKLCGFAAQLGNREHAPTVAAVRTRVDSGVARGFGRKNDGGLPDR